MYLYRLVVLLGHYLGRVWLLVAVLRGSLSVSLLPCVADVYRVFYVRLSVYVLTILKEKIIIIIIRLLL